MRKLIYLIIILVIPFCATAQKYSNEEKIVLSGKIDTLLQNYMRKGTLTLPGISKQNTKVTTEYKKLFTTDALIFDDITPKFEDPKSSKEYPYKLTTKSRNDYIDEIVDEFPKGLEINNVKININYDEFDKGLVKVALERTIAGVTYSKQYEVSNHDTLLLTIAIISKSSVLIKSIESLSTNANFKVKNDKDLDGVIDAKDRCPSEKGKMDLEGCPDNDEDGIANTDDDCPDLKGEASNGGCPPSTFAYQYVFSASLGYNLSSYNMKAPQDLSTLYNNKLDKSNTNFNDNSIKNPDFVGGASINGNIAYYFGRNRNNRNKGISLGITLTKYAADYAITNAKFEYRSNDGTYDYRRIVTVKDMRESMNFNMINIPLLLKFKTKFGSKWAGEIGAGPSLLLSVISNSTYSGTVDFGGVYSYNQTTGRFEFPQTFLGTETNYLTLTSSLINNYSNNTSSILFQQLLAQAKDLDFADNKKIESKQRGTLSANTSIAMNVTGDLFYHLSKTFAIKLGGAVTYSNFEQNKGKNYVMIDTTGEDNYESIAQSSAKVNYLSFGVNFGLILGLNIK